MSDLPFVIDHAGERRYLGLTPSSPSFRAARPTLAASDLIPESEWVEFEEPWPDPVQIKDQDGVGACNGHAAALSLELARYVEGYDHVPLSAWWVYGNLARWPIDSGSSIGDALTLLEKVGCAPESDVPYKQWNRSAFTATAKSDAPRFKIEIGEAIDSDAALATMVQRRQPMNFAIPAGARLGNLDSDGVSPLALGWCNHAVTAWGGMKRSKSGQWLFKWINSWGADWGIKGCAWLPVKGITSHPAFEAYTIRVPTVDPNDPNTPPPLRSRRRIHA